MTNSWHWVFVSDLPLVAIMYVAKLDIEVLRYILKATTNTMMTLNTYTFFKAHKHLLTNFLIIALFQDTPIIFIKGALKVWFGVDHTHQWIHIDFRVITWWQLYKCSARGMWVVTLLTRRILGATLIDMYVQPAHQSSHPHYFGSWTCSWNDGVTCYWNQNLQNLPP